jgi:hypothetical protein
MGGAIKGKLAQSTIGSKLIKKSLVRGFFINHLSCDI